jgi:hypothetical protein
MKKLLFIVVTLLLLFTTVDAQNIYKYRATAVEHYNTASGELLSYNYSPDLTITFNYNNYSTGYFKLSSGPVVTLVSYTELGRGYYLYAAVTKPNINCNVYLQFYTNELVMFIVYNDYSFKYIMYPIK